MDARHKSLEKSIRFGFVRCPGSWFNLILASLAGLPWIIALFKAILLGAFSGEHSPDVYQLDRFLSSVVGILCYAVGSFALMFVHLDFSRRNSYGQQVGSKARYWFFVLSWINLLGWVFTAFLGALMLPDALFPTFNNVMKLCGLAVMELGVFWSFIGWNDKFLPQLPSPAKAAHIP